MRLKTGMSSEADILAVRVGVHRSLSDLTRLAIDFRQYPSIRRHMDDEAPSPDWHQIITQLRLEAGRIMEDTSVELASILPVDPEPRRARLREGRQAANDIQALLASAEVLHRRCLGLDDQD